MIGIALDIFVLSGILYLILREYAPDLSQVALVVIGLVVLNFFMALLLVKFLPDTPYVASLLVMVLADGFIIMYFFGLTLSQAAIAVSIFFAYKFAFHYIYRALTS